MDSNHRPSGYEPDELPLLHAAMMGARTYSPSGHAASTFGAATFHDPVRDGSGWYRRAPRTPLVQGLCTWTSSLPDRNAITRAPPRVFRRGSPRPCARVASTRRRASSARRLPRYLRGGLPVSNSEGPHLGGHFPLRCFQRFLPPDIATEPALRSTTPPPAVRPRRSSRTKRSSPQDPKRP